MANRWVTRGLAFTFASLVARGASAQPTEPTRSATDEPSPSAHGQNETSDLKSPADVQRKQSAEPKPVQAPAARTTFDSDPIADGAVIVVSLRAAGILEAINATGEVRPQQVPQNFDRGKLAVIDSCSLRAMRLVTL